MVLNAVLLVVVLAVFVADIVCCVVAALKGKWFSALAAAPFLLSGWPFIVGLRGARPDSWWAIHRYDGGKMAIALRRHPKRSMRRKIVEGFAGGLVLAAVYAFSRSVP